MGSKSTRNFITTNAVSTIMSVPRKPLAKYVDTAGGATHDLEVSACPQQGVWLPSLCVIGNDCHSLNLQDSGLVPKYLQKKVWFHVIAQADDLHAC